MTRIIVKEIIWESKIIEHIKKHEVKTNEAEFVAFNFGYHQKGYGGKYLLTGRSGGRILTIVVLRREPGKYFIVTARDASKKERRRLYEKESKDNR